MANDGQRTLWNADPMVANWPKRERFTDSMTPRVLAALALQPGEKVLDIGCGGGKLAVAAARVVSPGGKVVGADISLGMTQLAASRAKEAKVRNATFQQLDAQTDKPRGGPFDAAMSQFGVMFFEDPVAAFANIRKQLKSGGRIAFACWQPMDKNPWFVGRVLAPFGNQPPAAGTPSAQPAPGPFAFGDPKYVRGILAGAGFTEISRKATALKQKLPADSLVDEAALVAAGVPKTKMKAATKAVNEHVAQFAGEDGMPVFPLAVQVYTARNP